MDLTGHPAPFPQLEILHLFPGLTAALSRCASVLPTWSLRKRSHHRHRRERNRSHNKPPPPNLAVFPRVCVLIASPRPTPSMPTKTMVRTPILHRPHRSRRCCEAATGASARFNSGELPLAPPRASRRQPPSATTRSEPPIPNWTVEIRRSHTLSFH
jgi:hypothetical protein